MRFQFPQFLDTKASLIGPLNFKQFIYVLIGGFIIFVLQFLLTPGQLFIAAIIVGGIALALGFLKIEGISLPTYIKNMMLFGLNKKRYIFKRSDTMSNAEGFYTNQITLSYSNQNESIQKENQ